MSRITRADQIRAQIAELQAEKAVVERESAARLAAIDARIEQAQAILKMFTPVRKKAAEPGLPLDGAA